MTHGPRYFLSKNRGHCDLVAGTQFAQPWTIWCSTLGACFHPAVFNRAIERANSSRSSTTVTSTSRETPQYQTPPRMKTCHADDFLTTPCQHRLKIPPSSDRSKSLACRFPKAVLVGLVVD